MRKYKIGLCGLGFLLVLVACNGDAGEAAARLDKAEAYYEAGDFFSARNEIDSVRLLYPKEVDALKRGLELMRRVDYKEAQRNLAYCDSLLPIREKEAWSSTPEWDTGSLESSLMSERRWESFYRLYIWKSHYDHRQPFSSFISGKAWNDASF